MGSKGAIAVAQQDCNISVIVIASSQVENTVSVEICRDHRGGKAARSVGYAVLESAIAIPQQNGNRSRGIRYRQVELAVSVQVRDYEIWIIRGPERIQSLRLEGAISIAQKDGNSLT